MSFYTLLSNCGDGRGYQRSWNNFAFFCSSISIQPEGIVTAVVQGARGSHWLITCRWLTKCVQAQNTYKRLWSDGPRTASQSKIFYSLRYWNTLAIKFTNYYIAPI